MEENSKMTAERSLEIITEQIERSRQIVAKDTGKLLFISGLSTIGMAILVGLCIYFTGNIIEFEYSGSEAQATELVSKLLTEGYSFTSFGFKQENLETVFKEENISTTEE